MAQAGAVSEFGFATIWYQWKNMLITPFYWLLGPGTVAVNGRRSARWSRTGTAGGLRWWYTLFAIAYFVFNQGPC